MAAKPRLLAIIPARGGSKGLPGKNIRPFAGLPLIAHSALLAKACPEISRVVVSTDSTEVAHIAKNYGADIPLMRPNELAQDNTPLWPVLQHALATTEQQENTPYDYVLLLDPTTPCRLPRDISGAFRKLLSQPEADGILGVSEPDFNPIWHCVIDEAGWMKDLFSDASAYHRRQDVPRVFRINGSMYIWKAEFMRKNSEWRNKGKHLMYEIPDFAAISIDTLEEFERAEMFVISGKIQFPWLSDTVASGVRS